VTIAPAISARVYRSVEATLREPVPLADALSFVGDLGYDSLRVASLSIALETELGRPVLLNDWLAAADDPFSLTVGSLVAYVHDQLANEV
jgi:acyl carrier protein